MPKLWPATALTARSGRILRQALRRLLLMGSIGLLSACAAIRYQPLATLDHIDSQQGYRLRDATSRATPSHNSDELLVMLMFSGGGTRAAALGYGVLETLAKQPLRLNDHDSTLLDQVDLVFGISGGSILAAYYSLHGRDTIPQFERRFLRQNLQKMLTRQLFAGSNLPRLTAAEFGRGDLLQEQLNQVLFDDATFHDLATRRKGPFAVISATDMAIGSRFDFTQEQFDVMCLDLGQLPIARAVAASSAVPLVFAPITLNNNGGQCGFQLSPELQAALQDSAAQNQQQHKTRTDLLKTLAQYNDRSKRPFIHLVDGGLTDNLGVRSLLDATQLFDLHYLYQNSLAQGKAQKIIIINVNAQNEISSQIDQSAAVPSWREVIQALINIPIDANSQESARQLRSMVDRWNEQEQKRAAFEGTAPVRLYYISLQLKDLADARQRSKLLNIPTSLYLPNQDISDLKQAAADLLRQSKEYQQLQQDLHTTAQSRLPEQTPKQPE